MSGSITSRITRLDVLAIAFELVAEARAVLRELHDVLVLLEVLLEQLARLLVVVDGQDGLLRGAVIALPRARSPASCACACCGVTLRVLTKRCSTSPSASRVDSTAAMRCTMLGSSGAAGARERLPGVARAFVERAGSMSMRTGTEPLAWL